MMPKQKQTKPLTTEENKPKKELKYRKLPNGLYELFFEGGGELPRVLSGNFTSVFACQKAIASYVVIKNQ